MKGKRSRNPLDEWSTPYNPNKGVLRPKIKKDKKEETIRQGIRDLKTLNSLGLSLLCLSRGKISINRQPLFFYYLIF